MTQGKEIPKVKGHPVRVVVKFWTNGLPEAGFAWGFGYMSVDADENHPELKRSGTVHFNDFAPSTVHEALTKALNAAGVKLVMPLDSPKRRRTAAGKDV